MEADIFNPALLFEKSNSLGTKNQEFIAREKNIFEKTEKQNLFAEKIWKGYKVLNLVSEENACETILRKDFSVELKKLEREYNGKIKSVANDSDRQNITEKFIADAMTLLTNRWNTVCEFKRIWRNRRCELRQNELELIENEYAQIIENDMEDSLVRQHWETLFAKHQQIIEEQEKLIIVEEEALNELEFIFDQRDNLLKLAAKLFEM